MDIDVYTLTYKMPAQPDVSVQAYTDPYKTYCDYESRLRVIRRLKMQKGCKVAPDIIDRPEDSIPGYEADIFNVYWDDGSFVQVDIH